MGGDLTPAQAHEREELGYVKQQFKLLLYRLRQLPPSGKAKLQGTFVQDLLEEPAPVPTPRGPLTFVPMGRTSAVRGQAVLTKQPGTIAWIDSFAPGSVFWDVGANVGAFTLYAALRPDTRVVAIEPAAVNYFALAANCEVNRFDDRVTCLLLGLGRARGVARLEVSQFVPGQSFSFRGKAEHDYPGRQAAVVLPMDELVDEFGLPCPNYIKIDVPGVTEEIIQGAVRTLRRPEVRAVHIELREESEAGQRIVQTLRSSGLVAVARDTHGSGDTTFVRPGA
jgi:FkbM family methyltransferase